MFDSQIHLSFNHDHSSFQVPVGCTVGWFSCLRGGIGIFSFAVSAIRLVFQYLYQKKFGFVVLVTILVCGFCSISLSVFSENKIGFLDLLFDVVWCFPGFSSENMHLNNLNRMYVFSVFLVVFSFDRNLL